MAKKENNYYFDTFIKQVAYSVKAAEYLQKSFDSYDSVNLKAQLENMHTIEHTADILKHEMMEKLAKEFLPPIEREDIVELAHVIDDVTDAIEDVMLGAYVYNIVALRQDVNELTKLIVRCCIALKDMSLELHNFQKSNVLKSKIIEISRLEAGGDHLYTETLHRLYSLEKDPVTVMAWTNMYDRFEKCFDCCNEVAKMTELIIMKNS